MPALLGFHTPEDCRVRALTWRNIHLTISRTRSSAQLVVMVPVTTKYASTTTSSTVKATPNVLQNVMEKMPLRKLW